MVTKKTAILWLQSIFLSKDVVKKEKVFQKSLETKVRELLGDEPQRAKIGSYVATIQKDGDDKMVLTAESENLLLARGVSQKTIDYCKVEKKGSKGGLLINEYNPLNPADEIAFQ